MHPKIHLLWNLGAYGDWLSEEQTFSTYDHQFVGPCRMGADGSNDGERLLHLGFNAALRQAGRRHAAAPFASRSFPAPYFVDTGRFPAKSTTTTALEAYYRPGPLLVGTEYFFQNVDAPESGDPFFHGGEVVVSWLATGETRRLQHPRRILQPGVAGAPGVSGRTGAWELVARFSYIDLDSGRCAGAGSGESRRW